MSTTRREFLAAGASLAAASLAARMAIAQTPLGAALSPPAAQPATYPSILDVPELATPESTKEGDMLFRKLGNTGEKVSLIGLGGHHLGNVPTSAAAIKLLRRAVDSGINFMDNSWDYHGGDSEVRMGNALKDGYRKKVFLMTKIDGQNKATAEKQMNESLKRLQTDTIDLLQLHEIVRWEDPDKHFAKGGSIEMLIAARKAGKIRYIGFTGHKDPGIHNKMLDVAKKNDFHFDSVQMPINILDAHFRSFTHGVVPRLVKEGTGVLAMKTLCFGQLIQANIASPIDCLHFAMQVPSSVVITGMESDARLNQALQAVKTFKPFTREELAALLNKSRTIAMAGQLEIFKTTDEFDGTAQRPDWLGV